MALRDLLDPEIFTFDGRDFANWLKAGIPVYTGAREPLPGDRVPDAFPYARGFIGRNEAGLASDIKNLYDLLPSVTQSAMERGVCLLWAETEFRDAAQFDIGRTLLELACQIQLKALVDHFPDSLTFLTLAFEKETTDLHRRRVLELRRLTFQASIELTSASSRSIKCLEFFIEDDTFDEPLLARGQALEIVRYLALKFPSRFVYWAGIFGSAIVSDYKAEQTSPRELRAMLDAAYGTTMIEDAVEAVRGRLIRHILTEDSALSRRSVRGLYDLVAVLHAGREGAPEAEEEEVPSWPWDPHDRKPTKTAEVVPFNRDFRAEMKGR